VNIGKSWSYIEVEVARHQLGSTGSPFSKGGLLNRNSALADLRVNMPMQRYTREEKI
jgi:hypothetical protein